jgi:hypothetical protein
VTRVLHWESRMINLLTLAFGAGVRFGKSW